MITHPSDESADLLVGEQGFDGIVVSSKLFLAGDESVDGMVAFVAQRDCFLHVLTRESLFKPFVVMAATGDQVVFGCATARHATAQFAGLGMLG